MKNNLDLQKAVSKAFNISSELCNENIQITAESGVITLTGVVDDYIKKIVAVDTARAVNEVLSVIDNIEIQYGRLPKISDGIVANIVLNAIKWNWEVPYHQVNVKVKKGQVTLEGRLQFDFQKEAAEYTAIKLAGVKSVINNITIRTEQGSRFNIKKANVDENQKGLGNEMDNRLIIKNNKIYLIDEIYRIYRQSPDRLPSNQTSSTHKIDLN